MMRLGPCNRLTLLTACSWILQASSTLSGFFPDHHEQEQPLVGSDHGRGPAPPTAAISAPLFLSLERMSRIVDIAYCVGNTGVSKPFSCVSRCDEFPTLTLAATWNTGPLLTDSCGYIAVDRGEDRSRHDSSDPAAASGPAILVAFRGTYSLTNTVIDLGTVPQEYVPYPAPDGSPARECTNCTVHMGFLLSWRNARDTVLPELKRLRHAHPAYPVHLVGHSLGGAVAALAALELRTSLGWDRVMVTTFGEPRIGNDGLARFIDAVFGLDRAGDEADPEARTYRRVTHRDDPVPLLPLSEWGFRSHAGEVYISKRNLSPSASDLAICDGDADQRCSGGADDSFADMLPWPPLAAARGDLTGSPAESLAFPPRLKLWQLFFAHRDYFWRLGLCVPGGDPANWGREKNYNEPEEL